MLYLGQDNPTPLNSFACFSLLFFIGIIHCNKSCNYARN
jgi:hypothetical protein